MMRSLSAVVAGFATSAVLVMIGTVAASAALLPGGVTAMFSPPSGPLSTDYLAANLAVGFAAAAVGGWLAVQLAPTHSFAHAVALAGLNMLITTLANGPTGGSAPGLPIWYPLMFSATGVVAVLAGGWLRARPWRRTGRAKRRTG